MEWSFTPFQKLNFNINNVVSKLSDSNIVGKGCSSVIYCVETPTKQMRHKNIVRLLGCCNNGGTRLLLFDYMCNGSLFGLLHEKRLFLDWDARYKIILGKAHGLEYLHHDCIPLIVHRNIKANNILDGPQFEAFLADFGLAKLVTSSDCSRSSHVVAGSYGYITPSLVKL
ncbi:LRR receptor-like serine/threonine-protein kinase RGI2 [Vicia villosa]|uniref:LRR receptor-like serine/threonine-protein kinase RGI2 n=1 Tax=Vicia villosa TaxID=3911 RepID=UPI00273B6EDF|nr:LRR receptor-like serine/threonine-protein kinase RGI2 [Vicia villosa]